MTYFGTIDFNETVPCLKTRPFGWAARDKRPDDRSGLPLLLDAPGRGRGVVGPDEGGEVW